MLIDYVQYMTVYRSAGSERDVERKDLRRNFDGFHQTPVGATQVYSYNLYPGWGRGKFLCHFNSVLVGLVFERCDHNYTVSQKSSHLSNVLWMECVGLITPKSRKGGSKTDFFVF